MAANVLVIELRVCWWVPVYLQMLGFLCGLMGAEPDMNKVVRAVARGMRIKINGRWLKLTA